MSWNTTCSVSSAPISSGQPVRLFFIASNRMKYQDSAKKSSISKGSISYSYNDFKIIGSIGLKAKYTDYGYYIFDEKSIEAEHILSEIKECYELNQDNENCNNKFVNISREDLNFSIIQQMISEGELYIRSFNHEVLNFVSIMAIHEPVYQMLINEKTVVYDPKINDYKTKNLSDVILEQISQYYIWKNFIDIEKERFIDIFSDKDSDLEEIKEATKKAVFTTQNIHRFGQDYERFYVFQSHDSLLDFLEKYHMYHGETEESVLIKIIESRLFSRKLEQHNIMIRPTMTSYETKNVEDFIDFHKKIISALEIVSSKEYDGIEPEIYD